MKAIIIGASSGMGYEVAERMVKRGWTVAAAARRKEMLEDIGAALTAEIDVNADDAPEKLNALIEKLGGIDLYFHAAGIGKQNPDLESGIELSTVSTNCLGFTRIIDTVFNYMASHGGGRIVCISSIAGTKGLGPAPSYSASKAFQNTYIEALQQLANSRKLGIRFTDLRPGFVDTPLLSGTHHYPMLMQTEPVVDEIMKAIDSGKAVRVIDWRWRIVTALWRRIPHWIWRKMKLTK